MPLARILTHHPERASALAEQLKQQGYRVEVAPPDQPNPRPADLEIEFEICERADALERAASLATELHSDVAVAPGVLQSEPEPVIVQAAPVQAEQASDREREFEAAFQPMNADSSTLLEPLARADVPVEEPPNLVEIPVMEAAPLPPVQFLDEVSGIRAEPIHEAPRAADPVPYLAQLTPFGTPKSEKEETASHLEGLAPQAADAKAAGPGMGKRAADFVGKSMAAMKVGIAETAESFRENLKEFKKRAQVRSAEAHASRVARMLDLEQRQAEAQARAKELEVARDAAAARLAELLRERDPGLREEGLRQEQLREEMLYQASKPSPTAGDALRKPAEVLRHASIAGLAKTPRQPMTPQMRAVLTGAAAVTFLFVIGIALGVLQPRTPLASTPGQPASSSRGAGQGGGVTLQPGGGVTVKAGTPAPAQSKSATQLQSPGAGALTEQAATPAKPSPRSGTSRRIAQQNGEDEIGDDVVVRHFNAPVPTEKPKQSGQQAGLKHFSDMQN